MMGDLLIFTLKFILCLKIHYIMSQKEQNIERDLLGSLLDDQQQHPRIYTPPPTQKRPMVFSAPPVLFDIGYKIDEDFLDDEEFDDPELSAHQVDDEFCKKEKNKSKQLEEFTPPPVFRKMSYQPADLNPFEIYQPPTNTTMSSLTPLTYYSIPSVYSPEEELMNNLGQVAEWSKDQHGSRTVQNILENCEDEKKQKVFNAIFGDAFILIQDRFGNYVFQKIFEKGLDHHKNQLYSLLKGNMVDLSLHAFGCRVIQKAIDHISEKPDDQKNFMKEIDNHLMELIQNQNGNHVVQKCLEIFPHDKIQNLAETLVTNLEYLAFHMFGCRVIQKYLETNKNQPKCQFILQKLLEMAIPLSQCQYGNYVMQHIVTKCHEETQKILEIFLSNIIILSTNKYASNVVEKAIQSTEPKFKDKLADWFISYGKKELIELSKHQFGNYVIQSLLEKTNKEKKAILRSKLKENMTDISKSQYGRHVLMQLEKGKFK